MAPTAQTLFDLFGDPNDRVAVAVGAPAHRPPGGRRPARHRGLAGCAQQQRARAERAHRRAADRVSVEAELTVDPAGFLGYPDGWPFVIVSMPDVEFRIKPYGQAGRSTRLFASVRDAGFELVLEGLPVEIRLPPGLVQPHPDEQGDPSGNLVVEIGEFEPGRLDDLKVIYRRFEPTSIFVHVRLYVNETYEVHIQPAVPISFGRCGLSRLPCKAVHDFRLIPSPQLAFQELPGGTPLAADREPRPDELPPDRPQPGHYEWLRHRVEPWLPTHAGAYDGLFSVRSVDIDEEADGLAGRGRMAERPHEGHRPDGRARARRSRRPVPRAVLAAGPTAPDGRHPAQGARSDEQEPGVRVRARAGAPHPRRRPRVAFNVESFFYRSLPAADIAEDLGLTFSAALVFGEDEAPQHALEVGLEEDYTIVAGYKRDFSSTGNGMPVPETGPQEKLNALLHWEIAGAVIVDIMGFRLGASLGRKLAGTSRRPDSIARHRRHLRLDAADGIRPVGVPPARRSTARRSRSRSRASGGGSEASTRKASRCPTGSSPTSRTSR